MIFYYAYKNFDQNLFPHSTALNLSTWLPFALVCLLGAMSPGPSLATVIRNTVVGSRYHGIATGVSHAFGIGVYALLSVTGLIILIQEAPIIFRVLTSLTQYFGQHLQVLD